MTHTKAPPAAMFLVLGDMHKLPKISRWQLLVRVRENQLEVKRFQYNLKGASPCCNTTLSSRSINL